MSRESLDIPEAPQVLAATTAEARQLITEVDLAAPKDLNLYKIDVDLARIMNEQGLSAKNPIDRLVLRGLGFGEDFTWMTPYRTRHPLPGSYTSADRMDPQERFEAISQPAQPVVKPYNT